MIGTLVIDDGARWRAFVYALDAGQNNRMVSPFMDLRPTTIKARQEIIQRRNTVGTFYRVGAIQFVSSRPIRIGEAVRYLGLIIS